MRWHDSDIRFGAALSGHVWERVMWQRRHRDRPVLRCLRCGYMWKMSQPRPTKDCWSPAGSLDERRASPKRPPDGRGPA